MSFNESNTVEQMILDALHRAAAAHRFVNEAAPGWGASLGGELRPRDGIMYPATQIPRQPSDVMVESWLRRGADPAQPRNRRPARPRGRGDLRAARDSVVRAGGWPGQGEREVHGLAARREDDAVRPERRARHRAAGRRRRPAKQPVRRHQPVDVPGRGGREASRRGVPGQRYAAGHR